MLNLLTYNIVVIFKFSTVFSTGVEKYFKFWKAYRKEHYTE
jgi:hypothetical protein